MAGFAMDNLKDILGKLAPVLGTAVGGPLGGAVVSILAQVFNVDPNEAAVTSALQSSDPEVIKANLARAQAAFQAAAEESITMRDQINAHVEMMRLDYGRGAFYSAWRPLGGWTALLYAVGTCGLALWQAYLGNYQLFNLAPQILMIGGPIMAIAGIYTWGKSQERVALAGAAPAGSDLITAVRGLVGRL